MDVFPYIRNLSEGRIIILRRTGKLKSPPKKGRFYVSYEKYRKILKSFRMR